jgi:flagellar biosynthesis chaperone FliJ
MIENKGFLKMEKNLKNETVKILKSLVEINSDRIGYYEEAHQNTNDQKLKGIFEKLIKKTNFFINELKNEIQSHQSKYSKKSIN